MVPLAGLSPAPLARVRHRSRASVLVALGLRLVLAGALVGVLAGVVEAALWQPAAPSERPPVAEICLDPPCLPESLPDGEHLLMVVPPLAHLLAAALGTSALLALLASGRARRRRSLLPVLGPVAVLIALEVVPHLLNPCLAAAALDHSLPAGCSRTTHGTDVDDRWHALHHAVVGGVPAAAGYAALLRRRRPELFATPRRCPPPVPEPQVVR
jgi:hypothetical protein